MEAFNRDPQCVESIEFVRGLDTEKQQALIGQLVDGAVYFEAWNVYFDFLERSQVVVTDEIINEAIGSVGLDPNGVSLWSRLINLCGQTELKRAYYELALSFPLYDSEPLFKSYRSFCQENSLSCAVTSESMEYNNALLAQEEWPDRYALLEDPDQEVQVRSQWHALLKVLLSRLAKKMDPNLQVLHQRRADFAFRQMCVQLPNDDSCVAQYALFLVEELGETEEAVQVAQRGVERIGPSISLQVVLLLLNHQELLPPETEGGKGMNAFTAAARQRLAGEEVPAEVTKESIQKFRAPGKAAAQNAVSDWGVYYQWFRGECALTGDEKFAAKVLQNGLSCCSPSLADSAILGEETLRFHTLKRNSNRVSSCAEEEVVRASQSASVGYAHAAWNMLVSSEAENNVPTGKAELRRQQKFPQPGIFSFLQRHAVGNYYPCSAEELRWIQFCEDFAQEKRRDAEHDSRSTFLAARGQTLSCRDVQPSQCCVRPDDTAWEPFEPDASKWKAQEGGDPDEIVGPREYHGRLMYHVTVDSQTKQRLRLQKWKRSLDSNQLPEDGIELSTDTAAGRLSAIMKSTSLSERDVDEARLVSVDWLLKLLVEADTLRVVKRPRLRY